MDTEALSLPAGMPLLLVRPIFTLAASEALLRCLEREDAWVRRVGAFYQYDEAGSGLRRIFEAAPLQAIEPVIQRAFQLGPLSRVEVFAHCYSETDFIGLHTDEAAEELRLVVFLNREWSPEQGGFLVFPNRADVDRSVCVAPLNNTGVAFMTGKLSEHAVSAIAGTSRLFSLVLRYAVAAK